jgi:hypothetical protein
MKGIAIFAGAAAMLAVAGCNRSAPTANPAANAVAPANQAAPQTAASGKPSDGGGGGAIPATSSGTVNLDRTFLLGRWTDDNDCSNVIEFRQDGGFVAASGGTGLWNLEGDELTLSGNQTATLRIRPIDQNTMTVINADGSLGRSTRC